MNKCILSIYADDVNSLCINLEKENQVFLCGLDKQIIRIIIQKVSLIFKKKGYSIQDLEGEIVNLQSLCILDIGDCTSLSKNKLLYNYLEKTFTSKTKVLMFSDDCSSLYTLERRVKSRFNDNTLILRTLSFDEYCQVYASLSSKIPKEKIERQFKIFPSLEKLEQIYIKEKYQIEDFTDKGLLSILNNIHLSILILSFKKRLEYNNVVREFKKFTVKINPLKNVKDEEILFYYYDLINFGLVSEKGVFLYNEIELKEYVMGNGTTYLKNLFNLSIS